ncbi:MAG: hypothetical protein IJC70_02780 [Firmicutes bacterium]|nr:hypothetical protein [Bacillota bacterium]
MDKKKKQLHNGVTALFYRHPVVAAAYYALLLLMLLLQLRPGVAVAAVAALFFGAAQRQGARAAWRSWCGYLPLLGFIVALQALTVHRGLTVLLYLPWGPPLTAESLRFGLLTALLFLCLLQLFTAAQADLAAGRAQVLLPASLPTTIAYGSQVMRQVGRLRADWQGIVQAQRSLDADFLRGSLKKRVRDAAAALSALFDLAMTGGMDAADLLAARGYGLSPRSSYRPFVWRRRDKLLLAFLVFGAAALLLLLVQAGGWQAYAVNPPADIRDAAAFALLWALLFIPLLGGEAHE